MMMANASAMNGADLARASTARQLLKGISVSDYVNDGCDRPDGQNLDKVQASFVVSRVANTK
jgi:hypothetical protein